MCTKRIVIDNHGWLSIIISLNEQQKDPDESILIFFFLYTHHPIIHHPSPYHPVTSSPRHSLMIITEKCINSGQKREIHW